MGRTNIVINEELVRKARKLTGLKTKREIDCGDCPRKFRYRLHPR